MVRAWWAALHASGVAWQVVRDFAPDVIFSIGGYAAGPTVLAGWLRRVPCVLLEPNAIPGLTNRLLGRLATRSCVGFPRTVAFFPPQKAVCTGSPVRWSNVSSLLWNNRKPHRLLSSFWGKRWRSPIEPDTSAGVSSSARVTKKSASSTKPDRQSRPRLRLFTSSSAYRQKLLHLSTTCTQCTAADLVVCRAGAMTIAELTVLGKPSILIPYPYAADDHQRANAEVLVQSGAARMIIDTEFTPERVYSELSTLMTKRARLEAMAQAAAALGKPEATQAVMRECLACLPSVKIWDGGSLPVTTVNAMKKSGALVVNALP
jgi:UDP-N-acetylglucosamine--N-acetylmuramyl-(pentapeptide) pyrophosphoryl-undecaprenol N-acetylglucosamine transferase